MCNPGGERAGLARPRAGEHENGALKRLHRLSLGRVQAVHIGGHAGAERPLGEGDGGLEGLAFVETAHCGPT